MSDTATRYENKRERADGTKNNRDKSRQRAVPTKVTTRPQPRPPQPRQRSHEAYLRCRQSSPAAATNPRGRTEQKINCNKSKQRTVPTKATTKTLPRPTNKYATNQQSMADNKSPVINHTLPGVVTRDYHGSQRHEKPPKPTGKTCEYLPVGNEHPSQSIEWAKPDVGDHRSPEYNHP